MLTLETLAAGLSAIPSDLVITTRNNFQTILGRAPTDAELTQFALMAETSSWDQVRDDMTSYRDSTLVTAGNVFQEATGRVATLGESSLVALNARQLGTTWDALRSFFTPKINNPATETGGGTPGNANSNGPSVVLLILGAAVVYFLFFAKGGGLGKPKFGSAEWRAKYARKK